MHQNIRNIINDFLHKSLTQNKEYFTERVLHKQYYLLTIRNHKNYHQICYKHYNFHPVSHYSDSFTWATYVQFTVSQYINSITWPSFMFEDSSFVNIVSLL